MNPLLRQAIFLDTETTGLHRGASIHEVAIFDASSRSVVSWVVDPHMVASALTGGPQDALRLTSRPGDRHMRVQADSWRQVLANQARAQGVNIKPGDDVFKMLESEQPWLANQIKKGLYPHLRGDVETYQQLELRRRAFAARGIKFHQQRGSIHQALGDIPKHLRPGSTLWIANAAFESKQIGAQLAADMADLRRSIVSNMETIPNPGKDPLYVTGKEVNAARVRARVTGDWTGVYEAYRKYTPAAGETAVRDILDVTRAMKSYGNQLRLRNDRSMFGLGIDVNAQLIARAFGDSLDREVHRAAEDAGIHEYYVLSRQIEMIEAMREVRMNTTRGRELLAQASRGEGALAATRRYFSYEQATAKLQQEQAAAQRLARAQAEINERGYAVSQGTYRTYVEDKATPSGKTVGEPRVVYDHVRHGSLGEVVDSIRDEYAVDWDSLQRRFEGLRGGKLEHSLYDHGQEISRRLADALASHAPATRVGARGTNLLGTLINSGTAARMMRAGAVGGVAVGILGTAVGAVGPREPERSVLSYNYADWLAGNEGMRHDGPVGEMRKRQTDFGSPYQGPSTSMQILANQELYSERENWLRQQYGAQNASAFSMLKSQSTGYSYIKGARPMRPGEFQGVTGDNLMVLDLTPDMFDINLEDPDTLTVKRTGFFAGLSGMMGQQQGFSFRLEGIDSPEVQHGFNPLQDKSYHAPQPGADLATAAAQAMIKGKQVQIVINPNESTYGRQLGVLFVDGKNYNLEAVRRGHAAFLPFGKQENSMVDWNAFRKAESKAYDSNRGMWAEPWARAFYEATAASGNRITFNTFTRKDRIVANSGTMSVLTTMEAAQAVGWNEAVAQAARDAGSTASVYEDKVGPYMMKAPSAPHKNYMTEQMRDLSGFIKTHGRRGQPNRLRSKNGIRTLDSVLAVDTMGTTTNVYTARSKNAYALYGSQQALERKRRMGAAQRQQNHLMFQSGVSHHNMEF